jgi:diguanylate cyclase (GGDEF)-like protein
MSVESARGARPALFRLADLGRISSVAVAYWVAAKVSLLLAIPPGYATAVWPPSGIAVAAVLLLGKRCWPGIWIGAALVNLPVASSPLAAVLIGTGNTLEALAAAALMRRAAGVPGPFQRGEGVVRFAAIAAATSCIAATVAMLPLMLVHGLRGHDLLFNWWTWWQGDATGIIVFTPLILSWRTRERRARTTGERIELVAFVVLLLFAAVSIFSDRFEAYVPSWPLTFVMLPFGMWAAFRLRQHEMNTANAAVCAIAVWYTAEGRGPFSTAPADTSLLLLLAFITTVVATSLLLGAVLAERSRAVTALEQAFLRLRDEAITDPLTMLYNRRFLSDYLPRELIRAERLGSSLALIMIDLDRFKQVNDSHGHAVGDAVLVRVAALVKSQIRGSDVACRYGGEEFALVLPDATPGSAHYRGEEIRSAIGRERDALKGVTASLGIALFPRNALDADALIRAADAALYEAKQSGRDQVRMLLGRSPGQLFASRKSSPDKRRREPSRPAK